MPELIQHYPATPSQHPPLLFIHGILHGAWCYDEYFLPYCAAQGVHASALSLRGHGNSALTGALRWVSIADYVRDVRAASQQIERETGRAPVLIGHSMGGLIVQKYLEQYAAPAAVLLASVPVGGGLRAMLKEIVRWPLLMLATPLTFRPFLNHAAAIRWSFFRADVPAAQLERWRQQLDEESFRAILDIILLSLPHPALVKPLPMLVINGAADRLFSDRDGQRTATAYQAAYVLIPAAAHDLMLDPAWQQAADSLLDWLKGLSNDPEN